MQKRTQLEDPYELIRKARTLEARKQFDEAEQCLRKAVTQADQLPLSDYKSNMKTILAAAKADIDGRNQNKTASMELDLELETVVSAYHDLLTIPFRTRLELTSFYIRREDFGQAQQAIEDACNTGIDPECLVAEPIKELDQRARDLRRDLQTLSGPEDAAELFNELFERLDTNNDGFVDEQELQRAKLDLSIDNRGQCLIRYLLLNYESVMKASPDEFLWDWKGISRLDVELFEKERAGEK